ncbi:DUF948 domain-containing protein [Paenibacillus sp. N1-5-1-14]|uniref:DUF948 domain-containing protein n=1 Tax=Paenibacillus radicibacter TaxID=2972488 RepID=UPI002158B386|nr:DUF948 domain-containing protein [Paenibacillus radicibacter]MCR8643834.1 DUF948 domain-containing protein [Paenibacillus radicibacter]
MLNVYEWSAVGAAVAFIVLVVYLIITLRAAKRTLRHMERTLSQASETIDLTAKHSRQLMRSWRGLSEEIYLDARSLRGVVEAISGFGKVVREFTESLSRISTWLSKVGEPAKAEKKAEMKATAAEAAVDWFTLGTELYRKCRELRIKSLGKEQAETHIKE